MAAENIINELAKRLSERASNQASKGDSYSWEQATDYVTTRAALLADDPSLTPQKINRAIRGVDGYQGPGSSFLSDSWACYDKFPEVFTCTRKKCRFEVYRVIASSKAADKQALRQWAEDYQPTQSQLRERIKELTGDDRARLGFRLMTTNSWKFASSDGADDNGFDGGISNDVVANLLHYFTDPGDVVVDPMAGSGRTSKVVETLPYFSEAWQNQKDHERGGPRTVLMSDIAPQRDGIVQADARESIPFEQADFILLDPPYWRIAEGKYNHGGETIEEWLAGIQAIGLNCRSALVPGGRIALILDDFLRSKQTAPLAMLGMEAMTKAGFTPVLTIYNGYTNACATMGPLQQWRAMNARLMVNGMKIISIFE